MVPLMICELLMIVAFVLVLVVKMLMAMLMMRMPSPIMTLSISILMEMGGVTTKHRVLTNLIIGQTIPTGMLVKQPSNAHQLRFQPIL